MHVKDHIAVIGSKSLPQHGLSPQPYYLARHMTACHRDDLHREWKLAEHIHKLALVRNANEFFRHGSHNFFTGQCSATPFYHMQVRCYLVRTIHIYRKLVDVVQVHDLDSMATEPSGGCF